MTNDTDGFGPWNPGISSRLPTVARRFVTIFNPKNARIPLSLIDDRSDFCGISPEDLAILRPQRLALHELLIRVTGDFTVPDGEVTADLGTNFRRITEQIWWYAIEPRLDEIEAIYNQLEASLRCDVETELKRLIQASAGPPQDQIRQGFFGRLLSVSPPPIEPQDSAGAVLRYWRDQYQTTTDRRRQRICRALARVINNIMIRHGRLIGDEAVLADLALGLILNDHGSVMIGQLIQPWVIACAEQLGLRLLPAQQTPVILNTKGASAAGKSTLRPLQRKLAQEIGIAWADLALISPDIWRKYLLDYESLGDLHKYAGMCTGQELQIIDQKLDRYIAGKAAKGCLSHLLIDRFRFDSFAEDEEMGLRPKLLTRFGDIIYFFFIITPPEKTVSRAWLRGRKFGRYKAVDDLLAHNIEAFAGMPDLFLTWARHKDKKIFFEFLDNSVAEGETPRTVAFGTNDEMTIVDLKCLIDAERYKKINIRARAPDEVYSRNGIMDADNNTAFIARIKREIASIRLADRTTKKVYLSLKAGVPVAADHTAPAFALDEADCKAALKTLLGGLSLDRLPAIAKDQKIEPHPRSLLGRMTA